MRRANGVRWAGGLGVAVAFAACHSTGPSTGTPAPAATQPVATQPAVVPAPAPTGAAAGAPEQTRGPRRAPPDPRVRDSLRRVMVAQVAARIAGRENEPASRVFENVRVLRDLPAGEFLRTMNEVYGRGLGQACSACHVPNDFASDQRKNKIIARRMQQMTDRINAQDLATIPELDEDWKRVTCVTCHNGTSHPRNEMPAPGAPAPLPGIPPG